MTGGSVQIVVYLCHIPVTRCVVSAHMAMAWQQAAVLVCFIKFIIVRIIQA